MGKQEVSWLAIDKTVVADAASVGSDAGSIRHEGIGSDASSIRHEGIGSDAGSIRHLSSGSNHGYLCV